LITYAVLTLNSHHSSIIKAVQAPEGAFESVLLQPRKGWEHTHLFGGKGVFPYWRSVSVVKSYEPLIIYVNGAWKRALAIPDIKVENRPGLLKVKFEETGIPFKPSIERKYWNKRRIHCLEGYLFKFSIHLDRQK